MVRLEGTQEGKTFAERMGLLLDYIEPFKQMWPFYWLKVAAICDPRAKTWLLCYFGLSGRWSDTKPIKPICDKGNAILAVSKQIDADEAWKMLAALKQNGAIQLLPDVIAAAKPEPDITSPHTTWQARVTSQEIPNIVANVAEPVNWRYLYLHEKSTRPVAGILLIDEDKYVFDNHMRSAMQDDLDVRGLPDFGSFGATRLGFAYGGEGPNCSITDFLYQFDLPLALRVERGVPDRQNNSLPLTIYCRRPLMLEGLQASIGDVWLSSTETLPIDIEISVEEGWSVGNIVVPYNCGKISFKFDNLTKALFYEVPIPTPEDQVTKVLGSMYHASSVDDGIRRWRDRLLTSDGDDFEITLLNALARFGIPVLFAGQLPTGGTATPGYDLVALNHAKHRAVLISAKGSPNKPAPDDYQKLLTAVEVVQGMLQGWYVTGILASHATNSKLGMDKQRTDLIIWSREDLETLLEADRCGTIDFLLWRQPNLPGSLADWRALYSTY